MTGIKPQCFVTDCERVASGICGVCDGWFCRTHDDHGPGGDGPHGAGLERVDRRGSMTHSTEARHRKMARELLCHCTEHKNPNRHSPECPANGLVEPLAALLASVERRGVEAGVEHALEKATPGVHWDIPHFAKGALARLNAEGEKT